MYKIFSKKGSLELSVNSIVIMVIAFVVLGLILVFSRNIFAQGRAQTEKAFAGIDLGRQASPDEPLVFEDITIGQKKSDRFKASFYNADKNQAANVKIILTECLDDQGAAVVTQKKPSLSSNILTVNQGNVGEFLITFKENGLTPGETYICSLYVAEKTSTKIDARKECSKKDGSCGSTSFFLEITG